MTATPSKISQRKTSQAGNVFFLLFAAVGMVGLLGASISYIMRGPVASMAEVTKRNMAENNMIASSRLAVIMSPSLIPTNGDCDGDGFVEPLPFRDAGAMPKPVGGGYLPNNMGASLTDPWGTQYGYCVWNHGPVVDEATTACDTASPARLDGGPLATYTSIAVISAGKNRGFETTCNAFVDVAPADTVPDTELVQKGATTDDYVLAYTYNEADSTVGGIWKIKLADATTAEIAKNLEIKNTGGTVIASVNNTSGIGDFLGITTNTIAAKTNETLSLGGALLLDSGTDADTCAAPQKGSLRLNATLDALELCNGVGVWAGGGGGSDINALSDGLKNLTGNNLILGHEGTTITTGLRNTATGIEALNSNTTANDNTAIGYRALRLNTSGVSNTAIGSQALRANTTAFQNTAIGQNALQVNTTGSQNTAIGSGALNSNTTAGSNTAIGKDALSFNTTGAENTSIGMNALRLNTWGASNTAIGHQALSSNTTASFNTAVGKDALQSNTTGNSNTAIGTSALLANTTGTQNTAIGLNALWVNTSAGNNTAIGAHSLTTNSTGINNTAVGVTALRLNTGGSSNTAIGQSALETNSTGQRNTATGRDALYSNTTASDNVAYGYAALRANTTGSNNAAVGQNALFLNTTGSDNTAIGREALYTNTTGLSNTAIGQRALLSNTTGNSNMASGARAMELNTTGTDNTASGSNTLYSNTTGSGNSAMGRDALLFNTTGASNTAVGFNALYSNTTGNFNTAMGNSAGRYITGGTTANQTSLNSVYIGADTRAGADGNINEIVIGNSATGNGSNTVTLGNASITDTILRGEVGIGTVSPTTNLDIVDGSDITGFNTGGSIRMRDTTATPRALNIDSNEIQASFNGAASPILLNPYGGLIAIGGTAGTSTGSNLSIKGLVTACTLGSGAGATNCTSDIRMKQNVNPIQNSLEKVLGLKGVTFEWKSEPGIERIGFIAQDVEKIFPQAVETDPESGMKSLAHPVLIAPVVEAIKEIMAKIDDLFEKITKIFDEITALKAENTELKSKLLTLEDRIKALEEKETNAAKTP